MKQRFFELARQLSFKSNHKKARLGCVLVKKNKVVSLGFNQLKTHTKSKARFHQLHAEVDAVLGIDKDRLKDTVAYIYRENKHHEISMAKPCIDCELILKELNVKKVFYTIPDFPYFEEEMYESH